MPEIHPRILVGGEAACRRGTPADAVVHACKHPCHVTAVGYSGSLPSSHPHYLVLRRGHDLYLNLIDPPAPLFKLESFAAFMAFAREALGAGSRLVIHCNQGESRAPTLALLVLAKELATIRSGSYEEAAEDFRAIAPWYRPGRGIATFVSRNWASIA